MKISKAKDGPFPERLYFERSEVEHIAIQALRSVDLLPTSPGPIRIDRFFEKCFGLYPAYEDMPAGLLGYTEFGSQGPQEVVVSRSLAESDTRPAARLVKSTLAHEGGHILLHSHLYALQSRRRSSSAIEKQFDVTDSKILCREGSVSHTGEEGSSRRYDGRWWEYQANLMIGALLLPAPLVEQALQPMCPQKSSLGLQDLPQDQREEAADLLSNTFDVNPIVARIRVEEIFPDSNQNQLTL